MFRRKGEDGLFDTNPENSAEHAAEATSAPQQTSTPINVSSVQASASSQPIVRPAATETRTAAPTANAFRSAASQGTSEITRNRLPEAKNATAPVSASLPNSLTNLNTGSDKSSKTTKRVLTVGSDILLKGEIATCDRLIIEGKVDATLSDVHTVEITEQGSLKGSAHVEEAEICGLFEGELVVRNCLVIRSTGRVRGKITFGEIEIERGGEMTGEIKTVAQAGTAARPARNSASITKEAVAA